MPSKTINHEEWKDAVREYTTNIVRKFGGVTPMILFLAPSPKTDGEVLEGIYLVPIPEEGDLRMSEVAEEGAILLQNVNAFASILIFSAMVGMSAVSIEDAAKTKKEAILAVYETTHVQEVLVWEQFDEDGTILLRSMVDTPQDAEDVKDANLLPITKLSMFRKDVPGSN